jgi:hypothetical protein
MKRLAIYAHYNVSTQVAEHVFFYLRQISDLGFKICFVSNSELSLASRSQLQSLCERVIVRDNSGLDFSMWKRGLAEYDLLQWDELFLTNSSIIGPVQPLALMWQNQSQSDCDFWGLTDNDEVSHHLQSYFLVFRKQVLQNPRFSEFWNSVLPYLEKSQVIRSCEMGLTCWLEESGFKWKAQYPQTEIWRLFLKKRDGLRKFVDFCRRRNLKQPLNSTIFAPDILLQLGMPFIKVEMFKFNTSNVRWTAAWLKRANLPAEIQEALKGYLSLATVTRFEVLKRHCGFKSFRQLGKTTATAKK